MNFAILKKAINAILFLLICCSHSYAVEPSPVKNSSNDLIDLNLLQKQLDNISGYSFSSEISNSENPDKKGHVSILVSGSKYRVENKRAVNPDGEKFHNLTAYDGKTTQQFIYYNRRLIIKTAYIPINQFSHRYTDVFLEPFTWFSDGSLKDELTDPSLDQLKNIDKWNHFKGKLLSINQVNLDGRECIKIEFYYKIEPDPKINITAEKSASMQTRYVVYLSKNDQCYPIGWDRLSMNGVLLSKYRIDDLKKVTSNGTSFYCPAKATRYLYGGEFGGGDELGAHSDSPKMTVTTEITSVQINPVPDDSEFTIDPSQADTILDGDHKTFIKVPR